MMLDIIRSEEIGALLAPAAIKKFGFTKPLTEEAMRSAAAT